MKHSEYIKRLKKAGCYIEREGGRHTIWYSPITNKTFSIGRHRSQEMPNFVYKEAVKMLGVS